MSRYLDSAERSTHPCGSALSADRRGRLGARTTAPGRPPDIVSGLSIGAFPAAVIAGALDFASALRLVALRGDLMEQAYPHGYGLTAIMGLTPRVEALIRGDLYRQPERRNADCDCRADEAMARWRSWRWPGASKAQRLAVSVPSHCALLENRRSAGAGVCRRRFARPRCAYLSGSTRARAVGSAADRRRSGDEHGAHRALAGGDDRRR
jgi:malonate decarboxylase epsilon subunit